MSTCEICGKREALYVCRGCGRKVCSQCIDLESWLCEDCLKRTLASQPSAPTPLTGLFPTLIFAGFLLILVGMILVAFSAMASAPGEGGGFFFIFPFFFGFGFGSGETPPLAATIFFAAALAFLAFIAYVFLRSLRLQP
ncbi:MAG: hypothetical protein ACXQTV_04000 [Candidatus Hecatellaceae archaeon]